MSNSHKQYVMVRGTYQGLTANAFWFEFDLIGGKHTKASIARSLIHGADERHLTSQNRGEAVSFRLMVWKARELGL